MVFKLYFIDGAAMKAGFTVHESEVVSLDHV